jgi:predicted metalloprotease with PDZ domain
MKPWLLLCVLSLPLAAQQPVRYELSFPNAAHHEAEVSATFSDVRQPVLEVMMSRSSPGRYALHEFAKNVYRFRASDAEGRALTLVQPSPDQWNVSGHTGTVVVEYTVYGDRADGTYAGIDTTHAHLNLPAVLVWARGFEKTPVALRFEIPAGSGWQVATQLALAADGRWTAPNMDRMMDSPVEIGPHDQAEWKSGGAQFRMALHHQGTPGEAAAFAKMCEAVVLEEEGVFGAFPKYDNGVYTFLLDYLPYASGDGMEHRDSTSISGTRTLKDSAAQLIGTISHEFFHSWNVKRIRPKSLEPFDYERADMSGELWFAEGFTNYYGVLTLRRAGLASMDRFTRAMGAAVNEVLNSPGREVFNVTDMSRHAPFVDAAVSIDPVNTVNTFISYYTYGQALALGIDLSIRAQFPGKSLDDWMRAMWRRHPDADRPYTLEDLEAALAESTGSREFAADVFRRHVYGKEPMDYDSLLARAGMLLEKRADAQPWLGAPALRFTDGGAEITNATLRGSPLYNAGLDRGDRITDWAGKQPKTQAGLDAILEKHKPGDRLALKVETRSGPKDVEVVLAESPVRRMAPYELADKTLTPEMAAFREAWLGSKAIHPLPRLVKYCPECRRSLAFEYEKCPYDGAGLCITPAAPGEPRPSESNSGGRGGAL